MTLCGRVVFGMDGTQVRNLLLFSTVFVVFGGLPLLTDSVMRVALSPPETIGAFFGFFSLTEKVSTGVGPALTAAMLFIFGPAPSGTGSPSARSPSY